MNKKVNLPRSKRQTGRQNYRRGHFAEFLVGLFLLAKGYRKIATNYITGRGTRAGEVDLIVCRGKTLVFVEVKQRTRMDDAAFAITPIQQQRIRRAAEAFVASHDSFQDYDLRFDAVLVCLPWHIRHIINAF